MKRSRLPSYLLLTLLVLGRPALQAGQDPFLRIIPSPQQAVFSPQQFKVTSQTRIVLGTHATKADEFAAHQLNEQLIELRRSPLRIVHEETLRKIPADLIYIGSPQSDFAKSWINKEHGMLDARMKEEGYLLDVSQDRVMIVAESPRGRFYGVMSLRMMFDQQKKGLALAGVRICDWPDQKIRGITDDISRGQVSTLENFKKIIRFLARHKLNVYSPYIEDVFAFKNHPLIGKGRGALTTAEIKELDAFALQHHVDLIPTFQTLGHWENILVIPEYVRYAEFPGASGLNVANDSIYPLLDGMIGEVSAAFSSPYFNMGADESMNVGLGGSKAKVAARGIAEVHAEHYNRVFEILKKYKKKPMMYGDMILSNPKVLNLIPKNVIIIDWQYDPAEEYPTTLVFKNAGFSFIASPSLANYNGPFPNYLTAFVNIRNLSREGTRNGSVGLLTSGWNNFGAESMRELNYYGYAWTAECAWKPLNTDLEAFDKRFFAGFFGNEEAGLTGRALYALLSSSLNQVDWREVWRHPFLPPRSVSPPMVLRRESWRSTLPLARAFLQNLYLTATQNRDHLRILSFVVSMEDWFARKTETAEVLTRIALDTARSAMRHQEREAALARARTLVADLRQLKQEFSSLWLETNRNANLDLLMQRYDRQAQCWEEEIRAIEERGGADNLLIESQWIYHPDGNPGKRDSSALQVTKAAFRKRFTVQRIPSSAKIQMIGDTEVKLTVNGTLVGGLYARRTPSLSVEQHRIKMWNIAPLLQQGENVITVEAATRDRFGSAGVNVYAELGDAPDISKILSDTTWEVTAQQPFNWSAGPGTGGWVSAKPRQYPYLVVKPNFGTGRPSWIER